MSSAICFNLDWCKILSSGNGLTKWFSFNLQGWLPQAAIDQAMSGVLRDYFRLLTQHYEDVLQQRAESV